MAGGCGTSVAAGQKEGQSNQKRNLMWSFTYGFLKKKNAQHRTLNVQRRIRYSINLKIKQSKPATPKWLQNLQGIYTSIFSGSLVIQSIKRSVIHIQRSMLDVRCSTFNPF